MEVSRDGADVMESRALVCAGWYLLRKHGQFEVFVWSVVGIVAW